jgi:hypothetical protein
MAVTVAVMARNKNHVLPPPPRSINDRRLFKLLLLRRPLSFSTSFSKRFPFMMTVCDAHVAGQRLTTIVEEERCRCPVRHGLLFGFWFLQAAK